MTWYWVHLRNGKDILANGEEQRDYFLRRRVPKALSLTAWRVAKIHECSECGTTGPWTDDWSWYGSYRDIDDETPVVKMCSNACKVAHQAKNKRAWAAQTEPIDDPKERNEIWDRKWK